MPDYQKGKIYKLWSPQGEEYEVYYGSTTLDLGKRKTQHKTSSRKCSSSILFEKYDDVRIELVEKCSCNDKEELNKKEGHYIRNFPCLNKRIPDRKTKEQKKAYYENNIEAIKEYRENNKEKIAEYDKEYREKNKERLTEYKKQHSKIYRENNKEKIKEKKSKKITCDCGCIITNHSLAKHKKTNKHLALINDLEEPEINL